MPDMPGDRTMICTFTRDENASIRRMARAAGLTSRHELIEVVMRRIIADEVADRAAEVTQEAAE
jgi:hypothetical protein